MTTRITNINKDSWHYQLALLDDKYGKIEYVAYKELPISINGIPTLKFKIRDESIVKSTHDLTYDIMDDPEVNQALISIVGHNNICYEDVVIIPNRLANIVVQRKTKK